ncbi:hypothetical protein B9T07_26915, partial [Limnospira fusiformis CCALA 023]
TDIDEHLERLEKFKRLMPRYSDVKAMGAVAGMVVPEEVARYGYRRGLFVLAQSGDSVVILNDDNPKKSPAMATVAAYLCWHSQEIAW